MKIDAVLTDFDGTLMDLNIDEGLLHDFQQQLAVLKDPKDRERLYDRMDESGLPKLMPGTMDLMAWCYERKIPLLIISNNGRPGILRALAHGWLLPMEFAQIICRSDGLPIKPHPAMFLKALEWLETGTSFISVGNTVKDVQAAEATQRMMGVSIMTVSVQPGTGATHTIPHVGKLKELVR